MEIMLSFKEQCYLTFALYTNMLRKANVMSTVSTCTLQGSGRTSIMQQIECVVLEAVKFIGILVKPEYGEQ